jgi:hypothetical protein
VPERLQNCHSSPAFLLQSANRIILSNQVRRIASYYVLSSQKRTELNRTGSIQLCKSPNNAAHNSTKNPAGFDRQQHASDHIFHSIKTKTYRHHKDQQFLVCEKQFLVPITMTRSHLDTSCLIALKNWSGSSSPKNVMSGFRMPPHDEDRQYTTVPAATFVLTSSSLLFRLQSIHRKLI